MFLLPTHSKFVIATSGILYITKDGESTGYSVFGNSKISQQQLDLMKFRLRDFIPFRVAYNRVFNVSYNNPKMKLRKILILF